MIAKISFRLALIQYKNWMQWPRYIPVDSHKRSHYSTAVAYSLSCSFVSPIIIYNTRNTSGEREMNDVLQEEDKKTAETEVCRLQVVQYNRHYVCTIWYGILIGKKIFTSHKLSILRRRITKSIIFVFYLCQQGLLPCHSTVLLF